MKEVEIIPDLWIGCYSTSNIGNFQEENQISCLVNCSRDLHFIGKYKEYNIPIRNNIEKYEIQKMYQYLLEVTEFIHQNLLNHQVVLIFCEDGIQKSPTIAVAYLMRYGRLPQDVAIKSVKSKKNDIFKPFLNFKYALDKFEKDISFIKL